MTYVIIFRSVFLVAYVPKEKDITFAYGRCKDFWEIFRINVLQDITDIFELPWQIHHIWLHPIQVPKKAK